MGRSLEEAEVFFYLLEWDKGQIVSAEGKLVQRTVTDKQGNYKVSNLPWGQYRIRVELRGLGYAEAWRFGYSGSWQTETVYDVYRHIQLKHPDYAVLNGKMILQIPADGDGGVGCHYGNLQVQVGGCYAEFEVTDRVIDAKVFSDGSMKIRNTVQSRQRIRLEGDPPQRDGFEPDFRGAREIDLFFQCPPDEPGVLRGDFCSEAGGNIYSKAAGKWYR